jgi:anthraniloyl-CoA monooxygenase
MSVRISAVDWKEGGVDSAEAVEIARIFRDARLRRHRRLGRPDRGRPAAGLRPPVPDAVQRPDPPRGGHPHHGGGQHLSFTDVNTILAAGRADLVLMARAHLWDPYWTRHAAYEMGYPSPWPPQYSSLDRYTPRFI